MKRLLAAALVLAAAVPAAAQPPAPVATIRHADLDLADPADARQMLSRIRRTAALVCRASPGSGGTDINAIERYDACFRAAVARGVADLKAPRVAEAYATGHPRRLAQR